MSKLVRELYPDPARAKDFLASLEDISGRSGVDIRLASEMEQTLKATFRDLGLDPNDTSAAELYAGLESKLVSCEQEFLSELGVGQRSSEENFVIALTESLNKNFNSKQVLVPKRTVLKTILKKHSPKAALKLLHYRSLDSALRRCPLPVLVAACELVESKKWRTNFCEAIDRLASNDFEQRSIEFCKVDAKRWSNLYAKLISRSGHAVYRVNIAGGVVLLPSGNLLVSGSPSLILAASISAVQKLRSHSSFTVRVLLDESVPTRYSEHVYNQDGGSLVVKNIHFSWQDIHHHLSDHDETRQLFEPHVSEDALQADTTASLFGSVTSAYNWWLVRLGLGFVSDEVVVSCNLYDTARNLSFARSLGGHTVFAMQRELDREVRLSYLKTDNLAKKVYELLNAASDFSGVEPDIFADKYGPIGKIDFRV